MNHLYSLLEQSTTRKGFVLVLVLLALVGGTIGYTVAQIMAVSGQGILDFEFGHSVGRINEVLGAYGGEGKALYHRVQLLDLLNPLIYSWFTAMLLHLLVRGSRWSWLVVLALLPGLFDYAENYYLYQFLVTHPEVDAGQVHTANILSLVKQGAFGLTVAAFVFAGAQKFLARPATEI